MRNGSHMANSPQDGFSESSSTSASDNYPLQPLNGHPGPADRQILDASLSLARQHEPEEGRLLADTDEHPQHSTLRSQLSSPAGNNLRPPTSTLQTLSRWIKGPQPSRVYQIQSSQWMQDFCDQLLDRCLPNIWLKRAALLLAFAVWIGMFVLALPTPNLDASGSADGNPLRLSCTSQLWYIARNSLRNSAANRCAAGPTRHNAV
jgi:hypothetical protein